MLHLQLHPHLANPCPCLLSPAIAQPLQRKDLSTEERLAAKLRLSEKRIISGTMDAVRKRLAPIRGIPTKAGGMQVCGRLDACIDDVLVAC